MVDLSREPSNQRRHASRPTLSLVLTFVLINRRNKDATVSTERTIKAGANARVNVRPFTRISHVCPMFGASFCYAHSQLLWHRLRWRVNELTLDRGFTCQVENRIVWTGVRVKYHPCLTLAVAPWWCRLQFTPRATEITDRMVAVDAKLMEVV